MASAVYITTTASPMYRTLRNVQCNVAFVALYHNNEKKSWPRLFKGWITLSTGLITIQRISVNKTNHAIRWIVIYLAPVVQRLDNAIHRINHYPADKC